MAKLDYVETRSFAAGLISDFGMDATLRRDSGDRPCVVVIYDYAPRDRETKLALPVERRCIISADNAEVQATPPDFELDQLVTYVQPPTVPPVVNEILNFAHPAKPYSPAGVPVAYELVVRR